VKHLRDSALQEADGRKARAPRERPVIRAGNLVIRAGNLHAESVRRLAAGGKVRVSLGRESVTTALVGIKTNQSREEL